MMLNNYKSRQSYDPAKWEYRVRRKDGHWLTQPLVEGKPISGSNQEPWTRRLCDTWAFDTPNEASNAARIYCIKDDFDPKEFEVIPVPKDPLAWLKAGNPQHNSK